MRFIKNDRHFIVGIRYFLCLYEHKDKHNVSFNTGKVPNPFPSSLFQNCTILRCPFYAGQNFLLLFSPRIKD